MMDLDLQGKRAVVTGASLGIGEAVVKMLAEHGAEVSFCARNPKAVNTLSSFESTASRYLIGFAAPFFLAGVVLSE